MTAAINLGDSSKQHWMKPNGRIACGALMNRELGLRTEVFHQAEPKCAECFELYREWWKTKVDLGYHESYVFSLYSVAQGVVKHWDEFGQEQGFERVVDELRRVLEERP